MPSVKKVELSPPNFPGNDLNSQSGQALLLQWLQQVYKRVGEGPFPVQGTTLTGLTTNYPPADYESSTAGNAFSHLLYVYDATGGGALCFSDGTSWIDVSTGVAVA